MPTFASNVTRNQKAFYAAFALLGIALLAACGQNPAPTATPAFTLVPSLTASPTEDLEAAVVATLTAMAPAGPTPTDITLTPTPDGSVTPDPEATEPPIVVTLQPLAGQKIDPPLSISLPVNWSVVLTDVQVLPDVDNSIRGFPIQVYRGPVTGGTGTIVLYWGFPNLNAASGETTLAEMSGTRVAPDLWSDGLRILNLAVVEPDCTVGTDLKRSYRVGNLSATGTQFSAINCSKPEKPGLPDTRGWFAGLQEKGLNFVFYVYVEGEEVMNNSDLTAFRAASDELQAILDTVQFRVPDVVPTPGS